MSTRNVTQTPSASYAHSSKLLKQYAGSTVSSLGTTRDRLPPKAVSSLPHAFPLMYLYSTVSPEVKANVTEYIPSASASLNAVAAGSHPWKEPAICTPSALTSSLLIST